MRPYRPEGALLAGVCAELAKRLGWNVWALRALFLAGLFIKTLATAVVYALLAVAMGQLIRHRRRDEAEEPGLESSELGARAERIAELERRFREMEERCR